MTGKPSGYGVKVEIKTLEETYDKEGNIRLEEQRYRAPKRQLEWWQHYVLCQVQHYSRGRKLIRESLRINSDPLKHVLRRIIRQYPGVSFNGTKMTLDLPLYCVFHYFDELKSVMDKEEEGSDLKDHLKLLLDFVKEKFTEAFIVNAI